MIISYLIKTPLFWASILVIAFSFYNVIHGVKNLSTKDEKGNYISTGLFILAGGLFLIFSLQDEILWSLQSHEKLSNTSGKIVQSISEYKGTWAGWQYKIWYEYEVNENQYKSNRVSYSYTGSSDKSFAASYINKYPVGKSVIVYYDPLNPKKSVLEPNIKNYDWIPLTGMLVAFSSSFVAIGLAQQRADKIKDEREISELRNKLLG
jgi:hypothetical protein